MTKRKGYAWKNFELKDLESLNILPDEQEVVLSHKEFFLYLANANCVQNYCGVSFCDDQMLAMGGWFPVAQGVLQVFLVPDAVALERPKTLAKSTRQWLKNLEDMEGIHRLQALVLPKDNIREWMRWIGFVYEGTLKNYTKAGQDYELWGRVK